MRAFYKKEIEQLENAIENSVQEQNISGANMPDITALFQDFFGYLNIEKLNRPILISLVDTIQVKESGGIIIKLRFQDELLRMIEQQEKEKLKSTDF